MPGISFNDDAYRYGFQGQEMDTETGLVNYKYRMHDARIGRFFAVDPLSPEYPWNSPYAFSENRVVDAVELEGLESSPVNAENVKEYSKAFGFIVRALIKLFDNNDVVKEQQVRLIFHGGTRLYDDDGNYRKDHKYDNLTFEKAAKKYQKEYESLKDGRVVYNQFLNSAVDLIDLIDDKEDGSIKSLDLITHGSPTAIYINKDGKSTGSGNSASLYSNFHHWKSSQWNDGWNKERRRVSQIDYDKFTKNAIIELHGCRGAANVYKGTTDPVKGGNIASIMSRELYKAGKTEAVVIANEQRHGPKNGSYRHGKRVVYYNGEELFKHKKRGAISEKKIQKEIKKKNEKSK